ncbi:MAG: ATP-dependent dethiobiotin synthetase BioD [Nannocystaceae bacterium]
MRRIFLIGTDTGVGKTAVGAALLREARARAIVALPFKPAESAGDDPERLCDAAGLDGSWPARIAPLRYDRPLAPGVAEDARPFLGGDAVPGRGGALLSEISQRLAALEADRRPALTVIEGAGGLLVPMPGGTWLPAWIDALAAAPVVIGRLGLGTINHTLLTLDALARRGTPALGFILSASEASDDPSVADNPAIIAARSGSPCLGILGRGAARVSLRDGAWARLLGG